MTLAAVALCAVMAQAAQFEWTATQIREGWADSTVKADGVAYLFLVGANGASVDAVSSAISGATDVTALGTTLAGMAIDTQTLSTGTTGGMTAEGISATAPATLFFAVISNDGHVYVGATATVDTIETLGATTLAFGSQKSASSVASAWATIDSTGGGTGGGDTPAVPEPTSGLLMLVGLGALALRRRRA